MIEIRLYKPKSVDLTIQFPTTWNECKLPELKIIAGALFLQRYTQPQLLIELIKCSIVNSYPSMRKSEINQILLSLDVEDLAMNFQQLISFINESVELTVQVIPLMAGMYAPKGNFDDITCGEFEDADYYFSLIQTGIKEETPENPNTEVLKNLIDFITVLWRKQIDEKRISYVDYEARQDDKDRVATLLPELLFVCLLWYMGCKAQLPLMFKMVYAQGIANNEPGSTGEPDPMAITRLIHHGAGPKNGTREDIRRMKLKEFLFDLQLEAEKEAIGN